MVKKFYFLVYMLLLTCTLAYSQDLSIKDPATGKYFSASAYADFKGTPFLEDEWLAGSVITSTGLRFNTKLKFNLFTNSLFLNKDGEALEISDDIKTFTLMPVVTDSNSYRNFTKGIVASGLTSKQFVEKLVGGKHELYKLHTKVVRELNEINVGIVKRFASVVKYYLSNPTSVKHFELDKKQVLEALSDKQEMVKDYLSKEKLSFKNEKDLIKVIEFYNTL
ncbi:hypothetical protein [Segetibacter aerophilus]|uniref:DUF4369 domain-containing protein n=1 Tax=Segetibacter aerophilus TaxID=670293 RepID=A0A512BJ21_9BACT|nr:hypothetical protein [Segetibacter aerophilus]GEO11966.1 hypothetical protein SAE01_44620 [Segetibacter aerophilus]